MKAYWRVIVVTSLLGLAACDQIGKAPAEQQPATTTEPVASAPAPAPAAPAAIPIALPIAHEIDAEGKPLGFSYKLVVDVDPTVRKLRLFEDGKELGPGDALHRDIREIGKGLYSHYKGSTGALAFYFSTSDNSDPNTNGRVYELR